MAIASDIITKFELFMDDSTDLSSQEELDLLNKIVQEVASSRVWQILLKEHTEVVSGTSINLPSDFAYLTDNANYTDSSYEASRPAIFIDDQPLKVISYQDRRSRKDQDGYAYIDIAQNKLVFTTSQSGTVSFDYSYVPADLTLTDAIPFPDRFKDLFYHFMCVDDFIIQQSDKAKSYAGENLARGQKILDQMTWWDSRLIQI